MFVSNPTQNEAVGKERLMIDLLIAVVFLIMLIGPCLAAMHSGVHQGGDVSAPGRAPKRSKIAVYSLREKPFR
jgi:hypothetical protein